MSRILFPVFDHSVSNLWCEQSFMRTNIWFQINIFSGNYVCIVVCVQCLLNKHEKSSRSLGPQWGGLCQVEVSLTILKTEDSTGHRHTGVCIESVCTLPLSWWGEKKLLIFRLKFTHLSNSVSEICSTLDRVLHRWYW